MVKGIGLMPIEDSSGCFKFIIILIVLITGYIIWCNDVQDYVNEQIFIMNLHIEKIGPHNEAILIYLSDQSNEYEKLWKDNNILGFNNRYSIVVKYIEFMKQQYNHPSTKLKKEN